MKIGLPFIFFWLGILALFASYWMPAYSNALSKTGWSLIILSIICALPKAIEAAKKDKREGLNQ